MDGGPGVLSLEQHLVDLFADRHLHLHAMRQGHHFPGSIESFHGLSDLGDGAVPVPALADGQTETAVAGLVIGAGEHQVTHARQPHEGLPVAAQPFAQHHDLVQSPGDQGRARVVTGALAVAHRQFGELGADGIRALGKDTSVVYDIKYVLPAGAADDRL